MPGLDEGISAAHASADDLVRRAADAIAAPHGGAADAAVRHLLNEALRQIVGLEGHLRTAVELLHAQEAAHTETRQLLLARPTFTEADRYQLLVEALEDYAIFQVDDDGCVRSWNPGALKLLGYSEGEAIGTDAARIFVPEDRASGTPAREMAEARRAGRAANECWYLRKDGTRFFATGVLVSLKRVGMDGFVKVLRDITDRKRKEEWIEEAHTQLEDRVAERTAALANANLALQAEVAERKRGEAARRDLLRRIVTAQEVERRRISRELHDQMGQYLTALSLGLRALRNHCPPGEPVEPLLQQLDDITGELGREVHRLAVELRPTALDDLGLPVALRSYIEEWAARTGIRADFHAEGMEHPRLPGEVETTLYRSVQEALNNVVKHAEASRVSVLLHHHPEQALLIVEDDGRGFDADSVLGREAGGENGDSASRMRSRLGLLGIQERVALAGGTFTIESSSHQGTTLYILIPLRPGAAVD